MVLSTVQVGAAVGGAARISAGAAAASGVVGLTTTSVLFCSHFHQIAGDTAAGKRSPLVRLGPHRGYQACLGNVNPSSVRQGAQNPVPPLHVNMLQPGECKGVGSDEQQGMPAFRVLLQCDGWPLWVHSSLKENADRTRSRVACAGAPGGRYGSVPADGCGRAAGLAAEAGQHSAAAVHSSGEQMHAPD